MSGDNFMSMEADSAFGMFDALGTDMAMGLEGDQLAGMFSAMEQDQILELILTLIATLDPIGTLPKVEMTPLVQVLSLILFDLSRLGSIFLIQVTL